MRYIHEFCNVFCTFTKFLAKHQTVHSAAKGFRYLARNYAEFFSHSTVAKKIYLLRAALCHEESSIGNVWLASADPRKFSKVAKSCKFLKYHKKDNSVF